MSLNSAMRSLMAVGAGMALCAGMAAAQEAPAADKNAQVSPAAAGEPQPDAAAPASTKGDAGGAPFQNRRDILSYAFGVDIGRDILRQKERINIELFLQALKDTLAGNKLTMSDQEVVSTLKAFEADRKRDLEHAKMMAGDRNKREGEAFFSENAKKDGVVTLPSGLQYKILKKGEGKTSTIDDIVVCNYRATLLDGTEIENSARRKEQPPAVPVKGLVPGWTQGLQLMPVGSKWQLFIPSQLAYGDKPTPAFGPYASMIVEVELLSIQDKSQTLGAVQGKQDVGAQVR